METLRDFIFNRKHISIRKEIAEMASVFSAQKLSDKERVIRRFEMMCEAESPCILPQQQIIFMRTIKNLPDCFTLEEWMEKRKQHYIHESGYVSNLCPDYEGIISLGIDEYFKDSDCYVKRETQALLNLCDKYLEEAKRLQRNDVIEMLEWIPRHPARTLKEAFQFFRILHYGYMLEGGYQIVGGRIDQMFYPYLEKDMKEGRLTEESALELIKDFFCSFNIDSDLYDGVQQGDNGQSIVLGGLDIYGNECFNLLSKLCLQASKENHLIDPKINLRVSSRTPLEIFELGSELTKVGLGFPQYLNDDVIIEGLLKKGYKKEDAYNYVVAACWEIIIPKAGFEVVNIGACNFPKILEELTDKCLDFETMDDLKEAVKHQMRFECENIISQFKNIYFVPSFLIEASLEPKYFNFGIHGTGISTLVDSLIAIREIVYKEKSLTLSQFKQIVDDDYQGYSELLRRLRYDMPKFGMNHEEDNQLAAELIQAFCDSLKGYKNEWNGIYRAGTGTAMFYLDHANSIKASFDGRRKNEPFSANYSPSIFVPIQGVFSIIESFTVPNLVDAMNGGPLTLEFSSSMFDSKDSIQKIALFLMAFIKKGGHQLQCNAVNLEDLKAAQIHPEKYRQLVVRIWGWSAYFCELDKEFQDHVIMRQEYSL